MIERGGSTASETEGMTFARSPEAVLTAVGDLQKPIRQRGDSHSHKFWTKFLGDVVGV